VINLTSPSQPPHSSLPTRPKGKTALVGSLGLLSITSATLTGCSTRAAGHAAAPTPAATVAAPAASPTPAPGVSGYMPLEPSASPAPGPSPTPAPVTVTYTSQRLEYAVTDVGPADITYGTDSISDSPPGGLGSLGTGTVIPWCGSLPYGPNANALYYVVTAQLDGSGDITCAVSLACPGGRRVGWISWPGLRRPAGRGVDRVPGCGVRRCGARTSRRRFPAGRSVAVRGRSVLWPCAVCGRGRPDRARPARLMGSTAPGLPRHRVDGLVVVIVNGSGCCRRLSWGLDDLVTEPGWNVQ
jgi:hypothetical protein